MVIAVQKSCIHASAVAVFVEWWIVTVQELCYGLYIVGGVYCSYSPLCTMEFRRGISTFGA